MWFLKNKYFLTSIRVNHNFCQITLTTFSICPHKPPTPSLPQNILPVFPKSVSPKLHILRPQIQLFVLCSLDINYYSKFFQGKESKHLILNPEGKKFFSLHKLSKNTHIFSLSHTFEFRVIGAKLPSLSGFMSLKLAHSNWHLTPNW